MSNDDGAMRGFAFRVRLIRAAFSRYPHSHGCHWEWLAYSNMREAEGWRHMYRQLAGHD